MPELTISAAATGKIPPYIKKNINNRKTTTVFVLISGDGYWGFENENVKSVTAAETADAGIPLTVGVPVALVSDACEYSDPILIFSPSGGVVNYTQGTL